MTVIDYNENYYRLNILFICSIYRKPYINFLSVPLCLVVKTAIIALTICGLVKTDIK